MSKKYIITYEHTSGTKGEKITASLLSLSLFIEKLMDDEHVLDHTISINTIEAPVAPLPPDMRVTDGNKFKSGISPVKR